MMSNFLKHPVLYQFNFPNLQNNESQNVYSLKKFNLKTLSIRENFYKLLNLYLFLAALVDVIL